MIKIVAFAICIWLLWKTIGVTIKEVIKEKLKR